MNTLLFYVSLAVCAAGLALGSVLLLVGGMVFVAAVMALINRSGKAAQVEAARRLAEHGASTNGRPHGNVKVLDRR